MFAEKAGRNERATLGIHVAWRNEMSKEAAAAILVQTMFTTDTSMEHLMMSHAKLGDAAPETIAKFIMPYYTAMLKEMDGGQGETSDESVGKEPQKKKSEEREG
jgi:hypothetical protein